MRNCLAVFYNPSGTKTRDLSTAGLGDAAPAAPYPNTSERASLPNMYLKKRLKRSHLLLFRLVIELDFRQKEKKKST
jgi:hypothetical protein